ncbi:PHO85 cyclin-1 [Microdochium nivale]|nr:PHO85 cyclin-1 [Microdochium nivale]
MASISGLSMADLNGAALENFVYTPVSPEMISYLAAAASNVIQCDATMMPPPPQGRTQNPTPPRTPSPRAVRSDDSTLPTLEEFITKLVVSSNVQVPTLMSTLVYLTRLRSRLQPMAKGLRCTTHRIFLAALILTAKYLNDSSPKNKHWANYSNITTEAYSFGFSRTEVNLMEKQLLFLLDWELRITEEDLYRELDIFLAPIRGEIEAKHVRRMQRKEALRRQQQLEAKTWAASSYAAPVIHYEQPQRLASPPRESIRVVYDVSTPPGLAYSSSGSSYASSVSSQQQSRSSTPLTDPEEAPHHVYDCSLYESPVEIVPDMLQSASMGKSYHSSGKQLLPYEISPEQLRELQDGTTKTKRARTARGVFGRMFGSAVAR